MPRLIALAAALAAFVPDASAVVVSTAANGDWDVTTDFVGNIEDNLALVMDQPWWDDSALAVEFADLVNDDLGLPNFGGSFGPYFVYEISSSARAAVWDADVSMAIAGAGLSTTGGFTGRIAVAEPVPEPAARVLTGIAALAVMVLVRRGRGRVAGGA